VIGYVNGASPRVRLAFPTMAILQTGQTVAPPLQRGFDAALGSDVTGDNTASAIDGQGWGATANEASAGNSNVAIGANAIGNSEFYAGVDGWSLTAQLGNTGALSLRSAGSSFATPYRGTLMVYQPDAGATGYTDIRWRPQRNGVTGFPLKVQPGDKVGLRANVSAHRCLIRSYIQWRDAAGLVLSYTTGPTNNAILSSPTEPDEWPLLSAVGTAPASAAWAEIMFRKEGTLSGTTSYMFLHKPMLALLAPGTTVVPQYSPGVPLDIYGGADVTGDNSASAIDGQGNLATGNMYYQASAPSSPNNGDFWGDTTNGLLKYRSAGAWATIASIGASVISVSRTNSFVKVKIGAGLNVTNTCGFSADGGTGPYTWSHEKLSQAPATPNVSLSSSTAASITASATGSVGQEVQGAILTTATDAAGKKAQFVSPLFLSWES